MNIKQKLDKANQRLKSGRIGVAIIIRGSKLSLRASLPPKPNSNQIGSGYTQQTISLNIYANEDGILRAEKEAKKVGAALALKEFKWSDYIEDSTSDNTISDLIVAFEKDYFSRRDRNPQSETTWKDYKKVYRRLDIDRPLTSEHIKEVILKTNPDTRTRKNVCLKLASLARFAGINLDFDIKQYSGKYSPKAVNPRELPTDEGIDKWCAITFKFLCKPRFYFIQIFTLSYVYSLMSKHLSLVNFVLAVT